MYNRINDKTGQADPAEMLMSSIVDDLEDGVYIIDPERRIIYWNQAAERITGYGSEEIVGRCCQDNLLGHIDKQGKLLCLLDCPMDATLDDGERRQTEVALRHKGGYRVAVKMKTVPLMQEEEIIAAAQIFTQTGSIADGYGELLDVLSEKTMNDDLTGIKNRSLMKSYLEYKLRERRRFQRMFCVLFMDIDNFSSINNTYGHKAGDDLLKSVATSFKSNVRGSDVVGRWGGDEFLGVFNIANAGDARVFSERVLAAAAESEIQQEGQRISVTCSVGVAIAHDDDTVESIVNRADAYMYRSKEQGKNRVTVEEWDQLCERDKTGGERCC